MMNKNSIELFRCIVISLVVLFSGCRNGIERDETSNEIYNVKRFVPTGPNKLFSGIGPEFKFITSRLNIYTIDNGFDSIQYRFWIRDYSACSGCQEAGYLLARKIKKSGWKGNLVRYGIGNQRTGDTVICNVSRNVEPSNWSLFLNELHKSNIDNWVGNAFYTEGEYAVGNLYNFIVIEIATTSTYRFIMHHAPAGVTCEYKECKELEELIKLFIDQFELTEFETYLNRR